MKTHSLVITPEILSLIAELDAFNASWTSGHALTPERLESLRYVATIESIGSSTRIEGSKMSNTEIQDLLGQIGAESFKTRDEQEVAGYADAMKTVFENYRQIPLNENYLKQLHGILLNYSDKDVRHRGQYKTLNNHVEAFGPNGESLGVVFKTATPFDTPQEMQALYHWAQESLQDKSLHPLLVIGMFNVVFLAIHPFQDGNGRLSRVLVTLLLLRAGYEYVPYSSMESVIEHNKNAYYLALRRTQGTLDDADPDWLPWLTFFLRSLRKQKDHLVVKIEVSKGWSGLPEDSVQILNHLTANERITIQQAEALTGTTRGTLKNRFAQLIEKGLIDRKGAARNTWYIMKEK